MTDRGYERISNDTKRSGSIDKQRERIEGYAGGAVEHYEDRSVSGAKVPLWQREGGARLLGDLQQGDRVLVTKIDRVARSVRDLLELVERIEERGCSIVFVDQNIDTSGPFGRFMLTLLGAIAELEAAIVAERRLESLESFKADGRHAVGDAPFGFRSVEREGARGLVIRPDYQVQPPYRQSPAEAVLEAVERVMAGESQASVRHLLNLSTTGMHKLLRNPRLAGMTPENAYETYKDDNGRTKTRQVATGVVTLADGVTPRVDPDAALLTMAQWRELQDFLADKPAKTWSRRQGYGGAMRCEVCGDRMYVNVDKRVNGTTGETHDTYVCRRVKHKPGESAPSVMVHKANARLEEVFLDNWSEEPEYVQRVIDDNSARTEALAIAKVRLEAAQRSYSEAEEGDEETEALAALQRAKKAVRAAEAMPTDRTVEKVPSGRTYGEAWEEADADERTHLLLTCLGPATLRMGRMPIEEKLTWDADGD